MKTKKIKKIVLLLIIWMSLPCLAQDKFTIHFKDGSDRTFHLDNIVSIYTSKYDSKNIFHSDESYQYVETLQGSFIYDISSIENIAFTKFNENNVSNNIEEVANTVNPIILENDDIIRWHDYLNLQKLKALVPQAIMVDRQRYFVA